MRSYHLLIVLLGAWSIQAKIHDLQSVSEFNEITQGTKPVVVEFFATWCSHCRNIKIPFEEVMHEKEFEGIDALRVDVDKFSNLADQHNITGTPTFEYYTNGKKVGVNKGIDDTAGFKNDLRKDLRSKLLKEHRNSIEVGSVQEIAPLAAPTEEVSQEKLAQTPTTSENIPAPTSDQELKMATKTITKPETTTAPTSGGFFDDVKTKVSDGFNAVTGWFKGLFSK